MTGRMDSNGPAPNLADALVARGCSSLPSRTNFMLADLGHAAAPFEYRLFERGVSVHSMGSDGLPQALRISVRNREENFRLLEALA